jgi:transcriptional regulator with XRE-family HTH domain
MPVDIPDRYMPVQHKYTPQVFAVASASAHDTGMRIREIRKARGLSQVQLAEMAGVEQPTISRIEKGEDGVTLRLLRQTAAALGVSIAELFSDERTAAEQTLVQLFRNLPPERQQGWLEMAMAHQDRPSKP